MRRCLALRLLLWLPRYINVVEEDCLNLNAIIHFPGMKTGAVR